MFASLLVPQSLLSPEAVSYLDSYSNPSDTFGVVYGLLALLMVIWVLQNMYALYRFKSYARKNYVIITFLFIMFTLPYPFELVKYLAMEEAITYIDTLLSGAVLALLYFSNIAKEFDKAEKNSGGTTN
ncbi:MAG: hypothetical protein KBB78_04135 [Candidatus Pacebacteria bacterium]|nr:hypothetical protein [Candidatus Paceibacterota bacterium]